MRLTFDYLDLEGFRSFAQGTFLDFDKIGPGFHFVRGDNKWMPRLESNGAGKSSLWGALTWALYGKTVGGLNRNDIKPWDRYGKPPTNVEVGFFIDKKEHKIERTSKDLWLDGKSVPQESIDRLIGMTFDIFTHTVLLGQGEPLFFDKSASEKLALFASVLNLDRWDDYSKNAKDKVRDGIEAIAAIDGGLEALDAEGKRVEDDIDRLSDQAEEWEKERAKRKELAASNLKSLEKELGIAEPQFGEASLKLDSSGTELRALQRDIPKAERELAKIRRANDIYDLEKKRIRDETVKLQEQMADLKRAKICPVCKQPLGSKALRSIDDHKQELLDRLNVLFQEDRKLKGPDTKKIKAQEKAIEFLRDKLEEFQEKVDKQQLSVDFQGPRVAELKARIASIKEAQREREEEQNPYIEQRQAMKKRLREIDKAYNLAKRDADDLRAKNTRNSLWVKGFREVKLLEVEECLQDLEITTNAMLDDIGLVDWDVRYAVQKETKSGSITRGINVMILSPDNDKEVKWEAWSGGEGQRLRICGSLALAEVLLNYAGVQPSLEILDEPTQHISKLGIQDICEFLADRSQRLDRQVFLTDQHAIESSAFSSVITVIKDKSGSRIKYD